MDGIPDHAYEGLCTPLPSSPLQSPNLKIICSEMEDEAASNADILKANHNLNDRFSTFEERMLKNSAEIVAVKENMKCSEKEQITL